MQKDETISEEKYAEEEERRKKAGEERREESKTIAVERKEVKIIPKEEHVRILPLKLEVLKPELKEFKLDKEIPRIEKERRTIPVPIIDIQEPSLAFREYKLDCKMPHVEKAKKPLIVPVIIVKSPPKLSILVEKFDIEIRKPTKIVLPKVKVPIYRKGTITSPKYLLESFNLTISEQLKELLERKEIKRELPLERIEVDTAKREGPSLGLEKEEEIPDLFNLLFLISGGKIDSSSPKVIFLKELENDAHIGILQTLCMRIYREKVGGKPKPTIISKIKKDEFKREVEKWMEAEDRIFSVGLEETESLDKDFWDNVQDRIEELFSQRFGFIIFNKPISFFLKHHIVDIIKIEPKEISPELKKEIASMIWGFVKLDDVYSPQFDYIFEEARKRFETKLRDIGEPYLTATKRDKGLHEADDLHYPIKLFLVKYLAEEMNLKHLGQIKEMIQTEYEIFGDYRSDIYVAPSAKIFANQVFEVETLFGQGDYPLKKIDETIEKYEKVPLINKVNVVLDNLTFLRHINELRKKMSLHRSLQIKGERKFDLEFYTLDVQNYRLVSLSEFARKLKQILEYNKMDRKED